VTVTGLVKGGVALMTNLTPVSSATLGVGDKRLESFLVYFLIERERVSGRFRDDSEEKLQRRMVGVVDITHVVEDLGMPNEFDGVHTKGSYMACATKQWCFWPRTKT